MTAPSTLDIAIIGMAGRFPGARNVEVFWRNLCAGVESVTALSEADLLAAGVDPTLLKRPDYVRSRAVLEDIDLFDAEFFGLTPREAAWMDPQHRLFLECAWEAFERAGDDPERAGGAVGVYAGSSLNGYLYNVFPDGALLQSAADLSALLVLDKDFLTTRVSYRLNLEGPSIAVQTACSTSLVAVHLACQGLLGGECDLALAGGVSISVPQNVGYLYQDGGIVSPDGHCRAFDARAQGTVAGSGVGVVLLKRLEDALAAGDSIVAVIKGSAVNNDGAAKIGYTAPRIAGQVRVIRAAQAAAGVDAASITYVEAHGTGTPLGDPIEVAALIQAFRADTDRTDFCALGSVKTNIGHLDAAAGVAGLIKTALALFHRQIPPSLHFREPSPAIDFAASPFHVVTALTDWVSHGLPRRAGVSSFGLGGTNAHVVLEEPPAPRPSDPSRSHELLVLSARTATAREALGQALAAHLEAQPDVKLADVAYTLQLGRRAFPWRLALACATREDAIVALRRGGGRTRTGQAVNEERPVVFTFSGQGAQHPDMARELYEHEPIFHEAVDRGAARLEPELGMDIRAILFAAPPDGATAQAHLDRTAITQPALFLVEYALAGLWMAWGVAPEAMIGHSVGEYVAACLAGCLSLDDALAVVAARGRLMGNAPSGVMLAVSLSEPEIGEWLTADVALAAVNAPTQCVLSGPESAMGALETRLAARGVESRLREHPAVREAVTVVRSDGAGGPRLVGYLVPRAEPPEESALRAFLEERLPECMIPADLVVLDALPLTLNGKVDRPALPRPAERERMRYVAPRTPTEEALARIWAEVLAVDRVGVDDDFFARGGHSLLAIPLMHRVQQTLGGTLSLMAIFQAPTVAALARLLDDQRPASRLIALRREGSGAPLFCLDPTGRHVDVYRSLADALDDRAVLGLPLSHAFAGDPEAIAVAAIADQQAAEIRARQPRGPYHLVGWSLGGVLAVAIARALESDGERVAFLGILDTQPRAGLYARGRPDVVAELAEYIDQDRRADLLALPAAELQAFRESLQGLSIDQRATQAGRWAQARGFIPPGVPPEAFRYRYALLRDAALTMAGLPAQALAAPIHVWWSSETWARHGAAPVEWQRYTRGPVHTSVVAGDHLAAVRSPEVHEGIRAALAALAANAA